MQIIHPTYWLLSVCIFLSAKDGYAQQDSTIYHRLTSIIAESRHKYAPDKRSKIIEMQSADIASNMYVIQSTEKEALDFIKQQLNDLDVQVIYSLLPDLSVEDKMYGIVNLSVANLRTQPSHAAEMATQVLLGTQVDILQRQRGDYRVRTPEGYIAWVPTSSIAPMREGELKAWKNADKLIYIEEFGKSYSEPDASSLRVSDLVYGNILTLMGEEKDFYKVKYPDGRMAHVLKKEALLFDQWQISRKLTAEHLISSAKSMLGLPYLWGGTSVKGVDCSGFTKTIFYMNGYIIPRDASQQVLTGEVVDILDTARNFDDKKALQNLKPGDLLFFAAEKSKGPQARVTHVAMYIGKGEFIHAAGLVRINSFLEGSSNYDDFQSRTVVAARRYIGVDTPQIQKIADSTYY